MYRREIPETVLEGARRATQGYASSLEPLMQSLAQSLKQPLKARGQFWIGRSHGDPHHFVLDRMKNAHEADS